MLCERDFINYFENILKHTFFDKYVACHKIVLFSKKYNYNITEIYKLQTIDLSCKTLKTIPAEMCQLQNLQELYLYSNQITMIPAETCQLPCLLEVAPQLLKGKTESKLEILIQP